MKTSPQLLAVLLGSSLLAPVTNAQSTWTGDTSNNWGTAGNWNPSGVPGNAVFTSASDSGYSIVLGGGNRTADITFDSSTGANSYTINLFDTNLSTTRILNLDGVTVEAGHHTISGNQPGSGTAGDLRPGANAGFNIASGASLDLDVRLRQQLTSHNYIKSGEGTLILSANNGGGSGWIFSSASTGFTVSEGVLRFAATNANGNSANSFAVSSGAALELTGGITQTVNNGTITLNGSGIGGNGALRSLSGSNAISGSGTGGIAFNSNSSIGVDAGSLLIAPILSGNAGMTKVGDGLLAFSGANTYTGSTVITAGTLEVQGSIASSSGITNDSVLVFNSDSAQAYGNAIGGSGTLTKQGDGTLTLTGNNTYTGTTTVTAGVLQVGDGGTAGTLGANSNTFVASGAELRIERSTGGFGYSYFGELSGSGTVTIPDERRFNFRTDQQNSGDLAFAVDGMLAINTSDGVTAVDLGELSGSGTIQRAGPAPGSPPGTVLSIGGKNTDSIFSGTITSIPEFAVEKVGTGSLTLSGGVSHGGPTIVSAGTLFINGSLGNSAVTVEAAGTIGGNGTLGNGLTIEAGGKLDLADASLGLNSTGILSLTGGSLTLGNLTFQDLVGWDWANADPGTYELIDGSFTVDFGSTAYLDEATAYDFGNGKSGYFESGSLNVVVIPEPGTALLGTLFALALLRRRRANSASGRS